MPTDPRSAAAVGRLYEALRDALGRRPGGGGGSEVTVSEIYQTLVPYARARSDLGFEMNADYEHALMRLLAGEGGYARLEQSEARAQLARELASANPDVTLYRKFAASTLRLAEPVAASALAQSPARAETRERAASPPSTPGASGAGQQGAQRAEERAGDTAGARADRPGETGIAARAAERAGTAAGPGPEKTARPAGPERTLMAAGGTLAQRKEPPAPAKAEGALASPTRPRPETAVEPGARTRPAGTDPGAGAATRPTEAGPATRPPAAGAATRPPAAGGPGVGHAALSWSQALDRIAREVPATSAEESEERALDEGLARLSSVLQVDTGEARSDSWPATRADAPVEESEDTHAAPSDRHPGVAPDECGSCGKHLPTDREVRFCPYCGSEQPPICAGCGDSLEQDWRFCPSCGSEA